MASIESRLQALENKHVIPPSMVVIITGSEELTEKYRRQVEEAEKMKHKVMLIHLVSMTQ